MTTRLIITALLLALAGACSQDNSAPAAVEEMGVKDGDSDEQLAQAESGGADKIFDMPYLMRDLDNGLRVLIVKTDFPDIVNLQIPVQTGSRNEVEPGKSGFAHFFEHMMFRGTDKYPADVYGDILKNAGADQNAYTTDDYTNYHITFTKDDLDTILELEADRFMNLKYTEDQFRTESLAVKGEYLKNYSNPIQKIIEVARDKSFTTHPYKHTTMGFLKDIEDMPNQMDYSKTFFDRWYRPEKSAVILVGDLDPENAFAQVKKHFGAWDRGSFEAAIPAEGPAKGPVYEHIVWEAPTQPWLVIAFRGPSFDPREAAMPAMDIFSSIYLSDSSDAYKKVVIEEQWADQFFSYFPDRKDPNMLWIGVRLTDGKHAAAVRDAVRDTLVEARTQLIDADKLAKTKSRLRYQFASGMDNSESIGGLLAAYMHFERDPEVVNRVYSQYAAVTPETLQSYANKVFVDAGRTVVTLSNEESQPAVAGAWSIDASVAAVAATVVEQPAVADRVDESSPQAAVRDLGDAPQAQFKIVARKSDSSPLVDVSLIFHTGAAFDPPGKKGLAALTAVMLTDGGSERLTINEIKDAFYPMAAGFGAQIDKEMVRLAGTVHKDNLDAWYALVREQLLTPGWREEDFERVQTQLINNVRTDLVGNNDEELGKELLYSFIYGEKHPYGSFNIGASGDLEKLTLDDVKEFYRTQFTAESLTIGLAGGYDDEFAKRITADMAHLPRANPRTLAFVQPDEIDSYQAVIVEKETPAVAVSFGFPITVRRGDPDWVALWLIRSWLGEHRSSNSHLYHRIREERGMNYGDYAYIEYFPRGMFQFHPDANLGRQQQIFQVWIRPLRSNNDAHFATRTAVFELKKLLAEGMNESDFEATRNYLNKFVSLLVKTQSRQLGYAVDSEYYGTPAFTDYIREGLADLTLADVNRVLGEQLQADDMKFVFVTKDAADLRQRLASNQASPIEYNTPKPELADEDDLIGGLPLRFDTDAIRVVPAEEVFN